MVNLNRQIGISRAKQGGFSAHQLGAPVAYEPFIGWGMGWLFTNDPVVNGTHDVTTVTGISGDGSASASFTVDTGGSGADFGGPVSISILPVFKDKFVVMLFWSVLIEQNPLDDTPVNLGDPDELINPTTISDGRTMLGYGKKGLLLSRAAAQQIVIPDELAGASFLSGFSDGLVNISQSQTLLQIAMSELQTQNPPSPGTPRETINSFPRGGGGPVAISTGSRYGDTASPGGKWRISLGAESGFAKAVDEVPVVVAAREGSVWFANYSEWNSVPYRLERETIMSSDQWQLWADGVSIVDPPVSVTPTWIQATNTIFEAAPSRFYPCVSIPFTDRRQYFEDEFGLVIP
jgi:hypothetical protein